MDRPLCEETSLFFTNRPETPIGRLLSAGYLHGTWRLFKWPMRLLGTFSLVYVTEGSGRFHDALGHDEPIQAGDLILLFPQVAHKYGPKASGGWSELYAYFDGPIFDLWQQSGLLDPAKPVHRQAQAAHWRAQLERVLMPKIPDDTPGQVSHLLGFLSVLTQMATPGTLADQEKTLPLWLRTALFLLNEDISSERPLGQIAAELDLPYSTFRKHFERETGLAPAHYRFARRMETACSMLLHTKMRIREIAESLNFSDAFYFSNRFRAYTGLRPSQYRREGRLGTLPGSPSTIQTHSILRGVLSKKDEEGSELDEH